MDVFVVLFIFSFVALIITLVLMNIYERCEVKRNER